MADDIFSYIVAEEAAYQSTPVPVADGWEWSMADHIKKTTLYKNSQLTTGKDDDKPIKNIIRAIVNVAYRLEGFDVKDIEPYVNDEKEYYKSFLTRKFHAPWARKYNIDTFIDELVESYVDYGLALVKDVNSERPEAVPLQRIAFCDQTDIMGGPIGEKHMWSPDQLQDMAALGWDADKIQEAIVMSRSEKSNSQAYNGAVKAKTPGRYIEVYEVHGMLPESFLKKGGNPDKYVRQAHFVTFASAENRAAKKGITFFKGKEKQTIYKALVRDKIHGRACGFGGVEELFEAQVWTTYSMIKMKELLDAAALLILQTADPAFKTKNDLSNLKTGDVLIHEEGKPASQVSITPQNMQAFIAWNNAWEQSGRTTGSANETTLGINPSSGTPLGTTEIVTQENHSMHEFRQGKIATFVGEIYRDWVLDYLVKEMNQGKKFLDELSLEELQYVADSVAACHADELAKFNLTQGIVTTPEMKAAQIEKSKAEIFKGGNKQFLEILKDELSDLPIDVEVNIKGKQKNLALMSEKLTNVIRQVIATPQVLQDPNIAKIFNGLLESSGMNQFIFEKVAPPQTALGGANMDALKQMAGGMGMDTSAQPVEATVAA